MEQLLINDVSDTALSVAAYRAQETTRQDAAFKDTLAARLAGERGFKIAETMPHSRATVFAMVVRTAAIDKLVEAAIAQGVDTVINVGAGLDTRPYRMKLSPALRWIEVDFPAIISYKNEKLADEKPACRLERIAIDLANESQREMLFYQLGCETNKVLIITEEVVGYLTNTQAASLSRSLHAIPSFHFWIQDYSRGALRRSRRSKDANNKLVSSPWLFTETEPIKFFEAHGWKVCQDLHMPDEAARIGRHMPLTPWGLLMTMFSGKSSETGNTTSGYAMFCRE
jgi:methyltransferase (TIGR00027 family)